MWSWSRGFLCKSLSPHFQCLYLPLFYSLKSESCFSEMAHTCLEARIFSPHNSHVTVGRGGLLPSDCLPGRPPVNLSFAPLFPVMMVLTGIHPNVERSIFVSLTGAVYVVGLITSYKNCQYLSYLMKVL